MYLVNLLGKVKKTKGIFNSQSDAMKNMVDGGLMSVDDEPSEWPLTVICVEVKEQISLHVLDIDKTVYKISIRLETTQCKNGLKINMSTI
jgi:hypothetical protein